jgi:3-dehydroquinate dehydratase-2
VTAPVELPPAATAGTRAPGVPLRIGVLNGPNLNLLGRREPALYGRDTLADVEDRLRALAPELGVELTFVQRNGEGELVDAVHAFGGGERSADGAIINAGAYSHTSLALRDAFTGVALPFVEVHVTNVYAREPERRHSMLAPAAIGVVCGLGTYGYELALRGLVGALRARRPSGLAAVGPAGARDG